MSIPNPQVLVGLNITDASLTPFFTLGDPVKGVLGNPTFRLGGGLVDITDKVRSIRISRGRSRDFSSFPAGEASVTISNQDRAFDPVYADSPYFGSIIPRRELKILSNNELIFSGWIDDWNLFYSKSGESLVDAIATDATAILAKQSLNAFTPTVQAAGARVEAVLSRPEIAWPVALRNIDTGNATMGNQPVPDRTPVLAYLQDIASSETGSLFVDKEGEITFKGKYSPTGVNDPLIFAQNSGAGYPFDNLQVVFGTELLYNEVIASREGGGTAIASAIDSQATYGLRELKIDGLLLSSDAQLINLVVDYATSYSEPEYRFESLEVKLHKLDTAGKNAVLKLDIGDVVQVQFTPNGIPPAIIRFVEIIRSDHFISFDEHVMTFAFKSLETAPFILDDGIFGRLDVATLT